MKKISFIFIGTVIINLLIMLSPRSLDGMVFGYIPVIFIYLLIPFVSGILFILLQNKNRSYEFLPIWFAGACINSFLIILVSFGFRQEFLLNWYIILDCFLPLVIIHILGGLIGLVIRGVSEQFKKYPNSKITLVFKKIFGMIFLGIGVLGILTSVIAFLVLFFYPSSALLDYIMVDFKLIEVVGVILYYLLLLSALSIILIPLFFVVILGLMLFFSKKKIFNKKLFFRLIIYFFIWLVVFLLLSPYTNSKFELKKAEMKENKIEEYFDINDFENIYISRFVKFDDIIIKQGEHFNIVVKGSAYDRIGLNFEKAGNTLNIKRSELETYYNTDTWTMENREHILFPAGTKHLLIEITMPDIEKIENEGANIELVDLEVDNIEIKLNKRFNNIKGNINVEDTLKLDAKGGIINLTGSAKNLIIDSGDCWIEMDQLTAEQATIHAVNTSRLNVYVTGTMEVMSGKNSGIVNHFDK
jgi:hypothetical protein